MKLFRQYSNGPTCADAHVGRQIQTEAHYLCRGVGWWLCVSTSYSDQADQFKHYSQVGKDLEHRVIKWFDYLWSNKQSMDEQSVLEMLPDKLKVRRCKKLSKCWALSHFYRIGHQVRNKYFRLRLQSMCTWTP